MNEKEVLKIETKILDRQKRITLVSVSGFVDQTNSNLLQESIDTCLSSGEFNLVFDLQSLAYMSSSGWGVLIGEIKRFRENSGDIKLANMSPEIYEIYQMLEFYHIIKEYSSVEDAISSFGKIEKSKMPYNGKNRSFEQEANKRYEINNSNDENLTDIANMSPTSKEPESNEEIVSEEEIDFNIDGILASEGIVKSTNENDRTGYVEFNVERFEKEVDISRRPLPDKIRNVVSKNPEYGIFKIKNELATDKYGNVAIGFWKLRSLLKVLELNTKDKRLRYFRSA